MDKVHGKKRQEVAADWQAWRELVEGLCLNGDEKTEDEEEEETKKKNRWMIRCYYMKLC